jgi:cytochrome aa3-600 menaquinol oxidase subunit II
MQFNVHSVTQSDFDVWVTKVKKTAPKQTEAMFKELLKPGLVKEQTYSSYPDVDVNKLDEKGNPILEPTTPHHHGTTEETKEEKKPENKSTDSNSHNHHH